MNGIVDRNGRALLTIPLRGSPEAQPQETQVWVDTGFTGDLVLPRPLIDQLQLEPGLAVRAVLADGRMSDLNTFVTWADWFGELREVEVISGTGNSALLGVGLLLGHHLSINYSENLELTII